MNDISGRLQALAGRKNKILSVFITAGYPDVQMTVPLARSIAAAGADCIELGIPFSDPVADGPVIQASSQTALRNGVSVATVLDMVREIRNGIGIPLILMGYSNSVFSRGIGKFISECRESGVDGLIIADLPPEESDEYRRLASADDIATIFLAAPTTGDDRLAMLDRITTGFVYCVSITGVTGRTNGFKTESMDFIRRARGIVRRNPLLVGFGISTPGDAREMASVSDGIIVGSEVLRRIESGRNDPIGAVMQYVASIREAIDTIKA